MRSACPELSSATTVPRSFAGHAATCSEVGLPAVRPRRERPALGGLRLPRAACNRMRLDSASLVEVMAVEHDEMDCEVSNSFSLSRVRLGSTPPLVEGHASGA